MRRLFATSVMVFVGAGCVSAYDKTYQEELVRLEEQERLRRQAEEAAATEEARSYEAVIYFDLGSAQIREAGYHELRWFVEKLREAPTALIDVRGYADSTGGERTNQELSDQRADSVARYLISQGIAAERIEAAGFSSSFPEKSNETTYGRSRNRRVVVRVR